MDSENLMNEEEAIFEESINVEENDLSRYIKKAEELAEDAETDGRVILQNINLFQQCSGVVVGDGTSLTDVSFGTVGKKERPGGDTALSTDCVTEKEEILIQWMAEHYSDFEIAFLITLAVFEKTPYMWIYQMAETLFQKMEETTEEQRLTKLKVPNNQRLQAIGAIKYTDVIYNHSGKVESEFICFQKPEYAKRVLKCVWNEFIFLRETITEWLIGYLSENNYSKANMSVSALSVLAKFDFIYFNNNVIREIFKRKTLMTDYAVAHIMMYLYEDGYYQQNVEKLFGHWATVGGIHYSLTALIMCVEGAWPIDKVQTAVETYISNLYNGIIKSNYSGYKELLSVFWLLGKRRAVYYKAIVNVLYDKFILYKSRQYHAEQELVGLVFLWLLRLDIRYSNIDIVHREKHKDMIFVKMCLVQNEVTEKIRTLWKYVWKNRDFHKSTKTLLEKYLYQYGGCKEEDIVYLRQFLYSFQETVAERESMDYFLQSISLKLLRPVRAAQRINNIVD